MAQPKERGSCPHCGVVVQFEAPHVRSESAVVGGGLSGRPFGRFYVGTLTDQGNPEKGLFLAMAQCPACGSIAITVKGLVVVDKRLNTKGNLLVYPRQARRPVPAFVTAVDPDLAEDFRQAHAILQDSPKASAALSRRCLQRILETKGGATKGDSLYKQIGEVAGGFPSDVEELMQAVRKLGNVAAHPKEAAGVILDVEDHEAEFMLEVIESLFDHYYVRPIRNRERLDAINEKLSPE